MLLSWSLLSWSLLHWMVLLPAAFLAALAGCVRIKRTTASTAAPEDRLWLALHVRLARLRRRWICPGHLRGKSRMRNGLRCIRNTLLTLRNVRLPDLWLLYVRTASFRSADIRLPNLRL